MDPNATLQRIFDAVKDNNHDEYGQAFLHLFDWLNSGGFSPNMPRRLPVGSGKQLRTNSAHRTADRCGSNDFAIQVVDPNSDCGPFEFVRYNVGNGDRTHRFLLT